MTYADTSALVKLLALEPETAALSAYLADKPEPLLSSELTVAELHRTAARIGVPGAVTDVLLGQLTVTPITRTSLVRAGHLPSPVGSFLRTGDAIHIVAAANLGASEFLTYDRAQARAAEALGFVILSPGRPDGWHRAS